MTILALIFSALVLGYTSFVALEARRLTLKFTGDLEGALAAAASQRIMGAFRTFDVLLAEAAEMMSDPDSISPQTLEYFRAKITTFPEIRGIAVFRADGIMTANTIPESHKLSGKLNSGDRPHFTYQQQHFSENKLYISEPIIDRISGRLALYLSRPLIGPDGQFRGTVVTGASLNFINEALSAARPELSGAAMLFTKTGIVVAHQPEISDAGERSLKEAPIYTEYMTDPTIRNREVKLPSRDAYRLVAYSPLGEYPFVVSVSNDKETVLAQWYQQALAGGLLVAISVLMMLFSARYIDNMRAGYLAKLEAEVSERTETLTRLNTALEELATTDDLTGVANRRRLLQALELEVARNQRYGHPVAVAILDIDFFKKVNDTYGHESGDRVLKQVAKICTEVMRDMDLVGRIGGEEFALLLRETDADKALVACERLRSAIGNEAIDIGNGLTAKVTVSIGITMVRSEEDAIAMLRRADAALYQAKAGGRDQVIMI